MFKILCENSQYNKINIKKTNTYYLVIFIL